MAEQLLIDTAIEGFGLVSIVLSALVASIRKTSPRARLLISIIATAFLLMVWVH